MERYLPTGNEMISLPKINELTAGIEDFTYLSMQHKGLIEVRGSDVMPLIQPFVIINGKKMPLTNLKWHRELYWIPVCDADVGNLHLTMTILTPIGERGFAVKLNLSGNESAAVTWGLQGCWDSSWHCINEDKPLEGSVHCYRSLWNSSIIFDYRCGAPMFACAPM